MKNTIQLCREFEHTHSLAEGIETREQLDMLMAYGCEFGQGFLFSKPLPLEQFNALLKKIPIQPFKYRKSDGRPFSTRPAIRCHIFIKVLFLISPEIFRR